MRVAGVSGTRRAFLRHQVRRGGDALLLKNAEFFLSEASSHRGGATRRRCPGGAACAEGALPVPVVGVIGPRAGIGAPRGRRRGSHRHAGYHPLGAYQRSRPRDPRVRVKAPARVRASFVPLAEEVDHRRRAWRWFGRASTGERQRRRGHTLVGRTTRCSHKAIQEVVGWVARLGGGHRAGRAVAAGGHGAAVSATSMPSHTYFATDVPGALHWRWAPGSAGPAHHERGAGEVLRGGCPRLRSGRAWCGAARVRWWALRAAPGCLDDGELGQLLTSSTSARCLIPMCPRAAPGR